MKIPPIVEVWSADNTAYLGTGHYLGNADVFIIPKFFGQVSYGFYISETLPLQKTLALKAIKLCAEAKIVLDRGDIIYGCECWWAYKQPENNNIKPKYKVPSCKVLKKQCDK